MAEDDVYNVLRHAQERSTVCREFLEKATHAVSRLDAELASEDAHLEAEGLRLIEEWRKLKAAVGLTRHQHDLDNAKAEASLVASQEACSRAIEEAQEADRRREAMEERAWELQDWCNSLEQQVELRRAALASLKGAPAKEEEL